MLHIVIIVLIGCFSCVLFGYLLYKICIEKQRKDRNKIENKNASTRRKRSSRQKKRRISRSKTSNKRKRKRRKTRNRKRRISRLNSKKKRNSKSKRSNLKNDENNETNKLSTINLEPIPDTSEQTDVQTGDNIQNKSFIPIVRRQTNTKGRINKDKCVCSCIDCNDSYVTLFQTMNNVDYLTNILPCDENDLSKYDYELDYDEEHLFRC